MSPVVQVQFTGDGTTTDAQTSISIPAGFTAAEAAANSGGCLVGGGGTFINVTSSTGSVIPAVATTFCNVTFTVQAATAAGNYNIVAPAGGAALPTACFDGGGNTVATCTDIANGANALQVVTISPEFNINPAIANPLAFAGLINTNIDRTITVENIGDATTNLTLSGTVTGAPFSIVSGLPNAGIAQGASANIVVRCNSATANTFNDTLVLTTNDPDDGEGTVNIPLQCVTNNAPTPEIDATFNAVAVLDGGSVTMAAPQNTSIQQVLSIGNSTGTAALTVGAVSGLSGVLSATAPSSASVAAGVTAGGAGASNITVTCNPGVTASTVQTISVVNGDGDENPFDVTIDCQAVLAAVPVVNPAAIGIVGAPSVIAAGSTTLSNTGGLQLDVASCVVPVGFTLDAPAAVPFSVPAGGNTTVTVSCTTPAAGAAPITGDLVCQSNGLANGGVITIPLSCSGTPLVVPVMSNMGKILLASLVIGLGLLGMGLRRQG